MRKRVVFDQQIRQLHVEENLTDRMVDIDHIAKRQIFFFLKGPYEDPSRVQHDTGTW